MVKACISLYVNLNWSYTKDGKEIKPYKNLLSKIWYNTIYKKDFYFFGCKITNWVYHFANNSISMTSEAFNSPDQAIELWTKNAFGKENGIISNIFTFATNGR